VPSNILNVYALVTVIVFASSCTGVSQECKRSGKKTAAARIESLTSHITKTMTDASADIAPVLTAVGSEVLHEVNSDMSGVTRELRTQMGHLSSVRKPPQQGP
jgi:hypothetical protein